MMSKKIVFTIDTNNAGGGERVIATLANYMASKGYETCVINSDSDSSFYKLNSEVKVLKMGLNTTKGKIASVRRLISKYKYLRKYFKEYRPDAVVTFLFNMEAPTILAGLAAHTNVIASVRNSASRYPKPQRLFRRFFYPKIKGVVFQSKLVQNFTDYKQLTNSVVIMNPLPVEIGNKMEPVQYEDRKNYIINVGRLDHQKNQKMLIDAFKMIEADFPDFKLLIFGEGGMRKELENYIESNNMANRIHLMGEVREATKKYRDAKLFVLSSDYEGFPNALAEAMIYGIPSISTDFDSGVASELIREGENGWLVDVGDTQKLAQKMRAALAMGEDINRIAEKGTDLFEILNSNVICKEWEQFLFNYDGEE